MKIKKYQKPAGVLPSMVSTQLRNIRQKIADSKWGPRIAQELGIKPKEIELSDGTKTVVNGGSSIIGPEMIANPVGAAVKTTKVITKTSPALKNGITIAEKLGIPKALRSNPKALEDPYYWGYKQWNDRYSTAVKSGNIEEAQRLRDLHFKTKTHNNKIVQTLYRGERHLNDAYKWTIGSVERPGMMFTTPEPALASSYADLYTPYSRAYGLTKQLIEEQNALKQSKQLGTLAPEIEQQWLAEIEDIKKTISSSVLEQSTFEHPRFRKFYLYSKNPKTFDAKGSWWSNIGEYDPKLGRYSTTDDLAISAKKSGYDALKIKNVRDTGNNDIFSNQNIATDIVVLDGHKVKLADPITRTDSGELIPIIKRDNFRNPDMRFKQGGILKGQNGIPEIYGGELNPAIIKPEPVRFILRTDPITKNTPITHSSIKVDPISDTDLGFFISKGSDDPTYNLFKANCSDATGECLQFLTNQDFTSGITTPIGVSRRVRKIFGKQPEYTESKGELFKPRKQSFVVPWYDYRKAKDLHYESILNSLIKKYRQDKQVPWSKEREDALIKNWWKLHPKLKYDLDEHNNIINPQLKRGGILKAQSGIKYTPTNSQIEIPEIEGYKPQFSNFWYGGDETKKEESVPVQEEHIQETPIQVETPVQSEWSDIKSMIKKHEGFTGQAKKSFGEPNPTVGYGFFNVLPDGRKITDNMTITEDEADKQLDIAIDKLRKNISSAVSSYNMKISDNQLNVLIDLGYHGGAGLVGRLLKEANGDINKIPGLLSRYATTAKYGDTSIAPGLKKRALRRVKGWNKG